jgi:hypothetical protein
MLRADDGARGLNFLTPRSPLTPSRTTYTSQLPADASVVSPGSPGKSAIVPMKELAIATLPSDSSAA